MPEQNEEVKEPIIVDSAKESGEESDNDDAITTVAEAEKLGGEEKETPEEESSEEKKPAEKTEEPKEEEPKAEETQKEEPKHEDSEEIVSDKSENTPKPVEGETPREKALRLEVTRLKELRRKERGQKLLGDVKPQGISSPAELSAEDKKVLEAFDPDQVENQKKLFGIFAKQQGYVKKEEFTQTTYKESAQAVLEEFLEKHPEYSEEQDKDGILWNRFKEEYSLFRQPANPKDFKKIFNRIHNDIFGITTSGEKDLKEAKAKAEKIKVASHGGTASGPKIQVKQSEESKNLSQIARSGGLKGFSEDELKELGF